jgi:AP-1-like transcription factor
MESMDYNYFASTAPQPYHYLGFGADGGLLPGVDGDASGPTPVSVGLWSCKQHTHG